MPNAGRLHDQHGKDSDGHERKNCEKCFHGVLLRLGAHPITLPSVSTQLLRYFVFLLLGFLGFMSNAVIVSTT
jgi:hypothetical protein